ncbi:GNAT family N-acetyltransferase [Photobacterium sp. TY1-4]|uniref:GNAT family N-acetyltransferase n=1 Tax=Photobacterium sp. TY1-4 TaxID=2899122 RepID=UPI0021BF86AE|nr:GNAT family N-acetyltransferase [Photobacterium sp. TY1-4]UXI03999.1 GNAT family N-acetyltransferase [Photobacterium sp. TY1-4]
MKFVPCSYEAHGDAILAILNDVIRHSTALYDYHPRTMANMKSWFDTKAQGNYPVIGIENDEGTLMGFATYGRFREQPAFKYTVEHSLYLHVDFRGRGLAKPLMAELISAARAQGMHVLMGAIDAENTGSIALHQKLGFTHTGTIRQAGFKFGRWLDLSLYQLILPTPASPCDG